jgi:hypothetical protein
LRGEAAAWLLLDWSHTQAFHRWQVTTWWLVAAILQHLALTIDMCGAGNCALEVRDMKRKNRSNGQCIAELSAGMFVIVFLVLFLFDVGTLLVFHEVNDQLAKTAARTVASVDASTKSDSARSAIQSLLDGYKSNPLVNVNLKWLDYDNGKVSDGSAPAGGAAPESGKVVVVTEMKVRLPVPIPLMPADSQTASFMAQHVEPIVALAPSS